MTTLDDAAELLEYARSKHPASEVPMTAGEVIALWDAATEAAALKCDAIASREWDRYKRGDHTDPNSGRADPHVQGVSCGADDCADAIRGGKL